MAFLLLMLFIQDVYGSIDHLEPTQLNITFKEKFSLKVLFQNYPELSAYITKALDTNIEIAALDKILQSTYKEKQSVYREWLPVLSAVGQVEKNDSSDLRQTSNDMFIDISQQLWDISKIYRYRIANFQIERIKAELFEKQNIVLEQIVKAYFLCISRQQKILVYQSMLDNSKKQSDVIQAEVDAGQKLRVDLFEIKAQELDDEILLVKTKNEFQKGLFDLAEQTGNNSSQNFKLDASLSVLPMQIGSKELIAYSMFCSPAILKQNAEINRLDELAKIDQNYYIPEISVLGQWGFSKLDALPPYESDQYWQVGIYTKIPFFDFSKVASAKAALNLKESASLSLKQLKLETANNLKKLFLDLNSTDAEIDALEKRKIYLEEIYRVRQETYKAGHTNMTDLLDARNQLLLNQLNYIDARVEHNWICTKIWTTTGGYCLESGYGKS